MFFLSSILGKIVKDSIGYRLGTLKDLVVSVKKKYPHIIAIVVSLPEKESETISWAQIAKFDEKEIQLTCAAKGIIPYSTQENEILLARDVLDKQIVDVEGKKLIRVNDLQLVPFNGTLRVMGVDISGNALVRRLGLKKVARQLSKKMPPHLIDWTNVDLIKSDLSNLKLKIPHKKLSLLHPADIADIANELGPEQRSAVFESLSDDLAAETLEEMHPSFQASLLSQMDSQRAAAILKKMSPDDAADLLADLTAKKSKQLLSLMGKEEAAEVKALLAYGEDTAGGIMTTEYVVIPPDLTAEQAIKMIRKQQADAETIYYIYVTDEEEHLLGVFSLRELIIAPPKKLVSEFMKTDVIKVDLETEQKEVAKIVAKYNLLAAPVVDAENRLQGIVTVDDAIDIVIPTAWKKRFPRIYA